MNLRTIEHLSDHLDEELYWRRKELIQLKGLLEGKQYTQYADLLVRASITLLYAHLEGFVKNAGTAYTRYVSEQRLKYMDLSPNFVALGMKGSLNHALTSSRAQAHVAIVDFLTNHQSDTATIVWRTAVNTKSNMNSAVLRDILCTTGLDDSLFATKEKLLDETLLASRNRIAHGQHLVIGVKQCLDLYTEVLSYLDTFRDAILNAAASKAYRRSDST